MQPARRPHPFLLLATAFFVQLAPAPGQLTKIPPELIQDEHVREEFGVNQFTTPSIKKLFGILDDLGKLPYESLKRPIPETAPSDRTLLALGLGGLIADGFLVVQAEEFKDFENVGRAVVKYAKVLGADANVTRHVKSALELGTGGEWEKLKVELAKTQADVEAEMVQLRDVDAAHLIALGGWLRAVEIVCVVSLDPFSAEKAATLRRVDIIEYFLQELDTLDPRFQELDHIQDLVKGVTELRDTIASSSEEKGFTQKEVEKLRKTASKLVEITAAQR